jgi:hypothetical protein
MLGDDQTEHGVAHQRQRAVVGRGRVLVGVRRMGERPVQQRAITEPVPQPPLELGDGIRVTRRGGRPSAIRDTS